MKRYRKAVLKEGELAVRYGKDDDGQIDVCFILDRDGVWKWASGEAIEPKFEKPSYWQRFPDPPYKGNTA